jgi:integrase
MAKRVLPLTDNEVKNAKAKVADYQLTDGSGMYLLIKKDGSKIWRFNYISPRDGKRKLISFGLYPDVTLLKARELRTEARRKVKDGVDPSEERKEKKQEKKKQGRTFEIVALEYVAKKTKEGKSPKYIDSINSKLNQYIYPKIGRVQMSDIKRSDVMDALKIADRISPHSAVKALQYTKAIFTYAEDMGYIEFSVIGSVKAKNVLTKVEVKNFKHIADPKRFGELLKAIDDYSGEFVTRQLLRFMPLVMTRPTEARLAKWSEIDFEKEIWAIPAERMKMRNDHIVPLSKQAIEILKELLPFTGHRELVFASRYGEGKYMSENTINNAIKKMGFGEEQTGHGFRHSASTMLHEHINEHGAHSLVIEACLAHKDSNEIRAVYNKAEYIAERRRLMQWWADYLDGLKG